MSQAGAVLANSADNPLAGAGFDRLYESQIKPELLKVEAVRMAAMRRFGLFMGGGVALVVLETLAAMMVSGDTQASADFRLTSLTLAVAAGLGYLSLRPLAARLKRLVLEAICPALGVTYGGAAPAIDLFQRLNLLAIGEQTGLGDQFAGQRRGCDFAIGEVTMTRRSGKKQVPVFQGQLIEVAYPKPFLGVTVIQRDGGATNRLMCPPGLKTVGLEDPRFERIFEVFGSDQIESRVLLNPAMMEGLVRLETATQGQYLRGAFTGGKLFIAVNRSDRFEIGSVFSPVVDQIRIAAIVRDLGVVMQLIDAFVETAP